MASSPKLTSLLLLSLLITLFSTKIHARESQFFSKVTHNNVDPIKVDPSNKKEQDQKQEQEQEQEQVQEQEPSFIPQTQNTGYGLYGHESGQLPPSTTTNTPTNLPFGTESKEKYNNNYPYTNTNSKLYNNDNNNYYNTKTYDQDVNQQNMGNTRLSQSSYNTEGRQGMSDTRFLENGRYRYNPPPGYNSNMKEGNSRNWYNNNNNNYNKGYNYGNNGENSNAYNNYNSFEGYQNARENQFQEEQNEFEP